VWPIGRYRQGKGHQSESLRAGIETAIGEPTHQEADEPAETPVETAPAAAKPANPSESGADGWDRAAEMARIAAEQELVDRRRQLERERGSAIEADDRVGPERELDQLDYSLLVICALLRGASGEDVQVVEDEWNVDLSAGEGTIYSRLRKLEGDGLLSAQKLPGRRGRPRTVYGVNGDAMKFVRQWLQTEAALPRFDAEIFVRLLAAATGEPGRITGGLLPLMKTLRRRLQLLDLEEEVAIKRSGGYGLGEELAFDLERTLLKAYLAWFGRAVKKLPENIDHGFRGEEPVLPRPGEGGQS
jgi:DNA-binding PadR family transcriptional regulator